MENTTRFTGLPSGGHKLVGWAVVLGIVIVLNVFYSVAVSYVYNEPQYEDYCPAQTGPGPATQTACEDQGGIWNANADINGPKTAPGGYCDLYTKCQKPWQAALDDYRFNAFVTLLALGVLTILAGILITGSAVISNGLSFGGVITLIVASVGYWGTADHLWKVIISGVGLLALLAIGYRLFRDK